MLNYTSNLKELILKSNADVQFFLKEAFGKILETPVLQEAIIGNLYYEDQMKRFDKIILSLKNITHDIR